MFRAVNYADDCSLLQPDTDRIQGWCTVNFTKLNIGKTRVPTFARKTNVPNYVYKTSHSPNSYRHYQKSWVHLT